MKRLNRTFCMFAVLMAGIVYLQSSAYAKSGSNPDAKGAHNAIVGLWDVEVSVANCITGFELNSFLALHKYEVGGTGQIVPSSGPTTLSAHMMIWSHVKGGNYLASVKMYRFDQFGNYNGWIELNNEVSINKAGDQYSGSGIAEVYNADGSLAMTTCPTLVGTRFTGGF